MSGQEKNSSNNFSDKSYKSDLYDFIKQCLAEHNISAIARVTGLPLPWLLWLSNKKTYSPNCSLARMEILYKYFTSSDILNLTKARILYTNNRNIDNTKKGEK